MNRTKRDRLPEIWWELRHRLWHSGLWQKAYVSMLRLRSPSLYAGTARPGTELVIEAFPRSANTFLVHAIEIAAPHPLVIAHHLHDPGQLRRGVELGVPVFVILRRPLDAVTSWKLKAPGMDTRLMLRIYRSFHQAAHYSAGAITFLRYEDVIERTGEVLAHVLARLGEKYVDAARKIDQETVFASIDARKRAREGARREMDFSLSVARPSAEKEARKEGLRDQIAAESPQLLVEAERLYRACLERAILIGAQQTLDQ